jgi:hypothetical protein
MKSRTVCLAALLFSPWLSFVLEAAADENTVAVPPEVRTMVTTTIPSAWTCDNESTQLVLRPGKEPVFVNLVNTNGQQPNETLDEYHRRHIVQIKYQIVVRCGQTLPPRRVLEMVKENDDVRARLQIIGNTPPARRGRGRGQPHFPNTPEGKALAKKYDDLKRSLLAIPVGYLGGVSVYIEPTVLRAASFLHKETQEECEKVTKQLTDHLTLYDIDSNKLR